MKVAKLKHFSHLRALIVSNPELAKEWAKVSARNLGGIESDDFDTNFKYLDVNAMETDEDGVTDEVNGVLDIVIENLKKKNIKT